MRDSLDAEQKQQLKNRGQPKGKAKRDNLNVDAKVNTREKGRKLCVIILIMNQKDIQKQRTIKEKRQSVIMNRDNKSPS